MGRPRRTSAGAVTGFVLRLARESSGRTQAAMVEALGVDVDTLQGWESGRRPLANMRAGSLLALRRRLPTLGADVTLLRWLDAALDADRILAAGTDGTDAPHPLAGWVHTRDTAHMLAWALTGTTPPALAGRLPTSRRGPVATAPQLAPADRTRFFDHLRTVTEHAARQGETGMLLHRQALYLTSYDSSPDAAAWTAHTLHGRRDVLARRGWSPQWPAARSTATALARLGDPQPLRDFVDRGLADDDTAEAANLNYWALWLGVLTTPQSDDTFMRDRDLSGWDALTLLRALARGLVEAPGFVDLYAHSLVSLLAVHPWLPQAAGPLLPPLRERTERLLGDVELSARSRRELGRVHYVLSQN